MWYSKVPHGSIKRYRSIKAEAQLRSLGRNALLVSIRKLLSTDDISISSREAKRGAYAFGCLRQ